MTKGRRFAVIHNNERRMILSTGVNCILMLDGGGMHSLEDHGFVTETPNED